MGSAGACWIERSGLGVGADLIGPGSGWGMTCDELVPIQGEISKFTGQYSLRSDFVPLQLQMNRTDKRETEKFRERLQSEAIVAWRGGKPVDFDFDVSIRPC